MSLYISSNSSTTLTKDITKFSMGLEVSDIEQIPQLPGGGYIYLTISDGENIEVVKSFGRVGGIVSIINRGIDGTERCEFKAGATVETRMCSAIINDIRVPVKGSDESGHILMHGSSGMCWMPSANIGRLGEVRKLTGLKYEIPILDYNYELDYELIFDQDGCVAYIDNETIYIDEVDKSLAGKTVNGLLMAKCLSLPFSFEVPIQETPVYFTDFNDGESSKVVYPEFGVTRSDIVFNNCDFYNGPIGYGNSWYSSSDGVYLLRAPYSLTVFDSANYKEATGMTTDSFTIGIRMALAGFGKKTSRDVMVIEFESGEVQSIGFEYTYKGSGTKNSIKPRGAIDISGSADLNYQVYPRYHQITFNHVTGELKTYCDGRPQYLLEIGQGKASGLKKVYFKRAEEYLYYYLSHFDYLSVHDYCLDDDQVKEVFGEYRSYSNKKFLE